MYDFLDRRLSELPQPAQCLVLALRLWAAATKEARCTIQPLNILYSRAGHAGAAWPSLNYFAWLGAHMRRPFTLGCPTCGSVSEDEALLLTAVFQFSQQSARHALSELIHERALDRALRFGRLLALELQTSG
jgi:hypothetical protein